MFAPRTSPIPATSHLNAARRGHVTGTALAVLALTLLALGGCVAYPAYGPGPYGGGYYAPGYAYAPPVVVGGGWGWGGGYHGRRW